jgi:hypothetical protein
MEEFLKILPNGQWSLEKNWKAKDIKAVNNWGETGMRNHLNKLPAATGPLRDKMIQSLGMDSNSRINPKTNEKEYKLHRAAHLKDESHGKQLSSWTPNLEAAHHYTDTLSSGSNEPRKLLHAWVPEKHIHSYLPPVQKEHGMTHGPEGDDISKEQEVLVHPHEFNIDKVVSGPQLEAANKKYGITKRKWTSGTGVTFKQSKAMHGKPHPSHPGRIWNHSDNDSEVGYVESPGYKYDLEGNSFVGRKNGKVVHSEPL